MMDEWALKSLLKPGAYPEPTSSVRLVQTHVSFLFITDNFVYKIKKPVDFGFLNFTTIDHRRFYCNEEVRLNRRLCPDTYLGVLAVRETPSGATFCGDGEIIDYAVKMKRLPDERMLDRMLVEGRVTEHDIRKIARAIAGFHLAAERGGPIDEYGSVAGIMRNWEENFQQAGSFIGISLAEKDLEIIGQYVSTFISENEAIFAERVNLGFIRDCDGDIHLENICLTDPVCIFDCIEFNDRFRYTDTAADIAFFLMDLDFHGKSAFSHPFLDEYTALTGDRGLLPILDFYKTYRAFVRGKVESMKLTDPDIPDPEKTDAGYKARGYFRLARGYILRGKTPKSLVITCGLMGSGKSATASALAFELGTEIVSSDALRKELSKTAQERHGLDEYGAGIYSPAFDEATYEALLSRSESALRAGRGMIVDATFRRRGDRLRFADMATRNEVPFFIVHTFCPESVARERLIARQSKPGNLSDGRWELFPRQKEEFEAPGSGEGTLIFLDTSRPMMDNIDIILKAMGAFDGA
jgi:aminoglycoside phosphotransferase family enzyme/predicted kinase